LACWFCAHIFIEGQQLYVAAFATLAFLALFFAAYAAWMGLTRHREMTTL
jgi:hypothetical protein